MEIQPRDEITNSNSYVWFIYSWNRRCRMVEVLNNSEFLTDVMSMKLEVFFLPRKGRRMSVQLIQWSIIIVWRTGELGHADIRPAGEIQWHHTREKPLPSLYSRRLPGSRKFINVHERITDHSIPNPKLLLIMYRLSMRSMIFRLGIAYDLYIMVSKFKLSYCRFSIKPYLHYNSIKPINLVLVPFYCVWLQEVLNGPVL